MSQNEITERGFTSLEAECLVVSRKDECRTSGVNIGSYAPCKLRTGFTLIEVLVVIAIIGIATATFLVSFTNLRQQRNLELASQEVVSALRTAQNYALAGQAVGAIKNNCSFGFQAGAGGSAYSFIHTFGDCITGPTNTNTIGTSSLRSGITFAGAVTTNFLLPRGEVASAGTVTIQIQSTNGVASSNVCVTKNGRIYVSGSNPC